MTIQDYLVQTDTEPVITALTDEIYNVLGENVTGTYLYGSLTYNDFDPGRSDIDLVTILTSPASAAQTEQLQRMHTQFAAEYPAWGNRIESSYTPVGMLASDDPPGDRPYYGGGVFYPTATYGNEWIINLSLLYTQGYTLFGKPITEVFRPIDIRLVQRACIADLHAEWEPKLHDPEWMENPHQQSYLVLNLCRILNTVYNARTCSKSESALWVKRSFPQWTTLIDDAINWQYGQSMNNTAAVLDFLRFVLTEVGHISA